MARVYARALATISRSFLKLPRENSYDTVFILNPSVLATSNRIIQFENHGSKIIIP